MTTADSDHLKKIGLNDDLKTTNDHQELYISQSRRQTGSIVVVKNLLSCKGVIDLSHPEQL